MYSISLTPVKRICWIHSKHQKKEIENRDTHQFALENKASGQKLTKNEIFAIMSLLTSSEDHALCQIWSIRWQATLDTVSTSFLWIVRKFWRTMIWQDFSWKVFNFWRTMIWQDFSWKVFDFDALWFDKISQGKFLIFDVLWFDKISRDSAGDTKEVQVILILFQFS